MSLTRETMGLRTHPDSLERLVGGFRQGRSCGELMGTLWSRHSKRTVIFGERHSCPCCRDCDFPFPAQFVLVTWDVCSLICLGSGFPALISMVQCSLIKEVLLPTPPHPTPPAALMVPANQVKALSRPCLPSSITQALGSAAAI